MRKHILGLTLLASLIVAGNSVGSSRAIFVTSALPETSPFGSIIGNERECSSWNYISTLNNVTLEFRACDGYKNYSREGFDGGYIQLKWDNTSNSEKKAKYTLRVQCPDDGTYETGVKEQTIPANTKDHFTMGYQCFNSIKRPSVIDSHLFDVKPLL